MLTTRRAPATEWQRLLTDLGISPRDRILVVEPSSGSLVALPAVPVLTGPHGMALLGPPLDAPLPEDATATATGLPADSVDATLLFSPWTNASQVGAVAKEAIRITRPGGRVALGTLDAGTLLDASPSAYPAALGFQLFPDLASRLRDAHRHDAMIGIELLRAGIHDVVVDPFDVPMAYYDSLDECVADVEAGAWPGTDTLDDARRQILAHEVRRLLKGRRFPLVDELPWLIARGTKGS